MVNPHYEGEPDAFKASDSTPTERLLVALHGDLHDVIPQMLNEPGATRKEVAHKLSVSPAWVYNWLKDNGYTRLYVRTEGGES